MESLEDISSDFATSEKVARGLLILAQAYHLSVDVHRDRWQFAVEIDTLLQDADLSKSLCRWLVSKGYAEHANEVTSAGDEARRFVDGGRLAFGKQTCFTITAAGLSIAEHGPRPSQRFSAAPPASTEGGSILNRSLTSRAPVARPSWDGERHELSVLGKIVKRFKHPSPNQELVLEAFEEERWPSRIDDPIPQHPDLCPKRRLNDTIKSLNNSQRNNLIRFMGDGTGRGVLWDLITEDAN
ncbi:MAG: hypothetical protein AAF802_01320 [Planctomycetota bacterium]